MPQQDIHEDATGKPKSIDNVQAKHQTHYKKHYDEESFY
jgi:hypothetical protein